MLVQLLVITGFEEHFQKMNEIRRKQCARYGIPVLFCYNGSVPEGYAFKEDEIYWNVGIADKESSKTTMIQGMNPSMFVKFQKGVLELKEKNETPIFYVRCTASCFIDFKRLYILLRVLPNKECIAGPYDIKYDDRIFCNGTCMIFSADVAHKLANESIENQMVWIENDDVSLSWLGVKYGTLFDTTYWFSYYESLEDLPHELKQAPAKTLFYRIKNPKDRLAIDVGLWKMLSEKIDAFDV